MRRTIFVFLSVWWLFAYRQIAAYKYKQITINRSETMWNTANCCKQVNGTPIHTHRIYSRKLNFAPHSFLSTTLSHIQTFISIWRHLIFGQWHYRFTNIREKPGRIEKNYTSSSSITEHNQVNLFFIIY